MGGREGEDLYIFGGAGYKTARGREIEKSENHNCGAAALRFASPSSIFREGTNERRACAPPPNQHTRGDGVFIILIVASLVLRRAGVPYLAPL